MLQDDRIDIWQYPLTSDCSFARTFLSPDELIRADRYYFTRHQRRFTIARAMLRLILSRYCDIPARELIFHHNQYGKPELLHRPELQFNLSHSGDTALLAIGKEKPLGIDLEFFTARPYIGIGNNMFSTEENRSFKGVVERLKPLAFFNIWAQKEALIKACGMGLSYPTQTFTVPAYPTPHQIVFDTLHEKKWQMITFQPHVSCCAALCCHLEVKDIRYTTVKRLNDLLREM